MSDKFHTLNNKTGHFNLLDGQIDDIINTRKSLVSGLDQESVSFPSGTVVQPTSCKLLTGGKSNTNKRTFVLVDYPKQGETYGYYKGMYPKQVAKKVANFLSKKHNLGNDDQKFVVFTIREITKRTKKENREYKYIGTRIKLNKPNKVNYNGKIIFHNYNILVTKYDDSFNSSFDVTNIL